MQENIYATPFGIQFNSRAKELCNRYPQKFLSLQEIAVEKRLDLVLRMLIMKKLDITLGFYEIDLPELNEVEQMKFKKRSEERREKEILRDDLIIEYYKNTLETIRSHKLQLHEIFIDGTLHCEY